MKKNNLKFRIILTTVIIVTVTSTLLGAGLLLIKQKLEEATFGHMVKDHLTILLSEPNPETILANPLFKEWRLYMGDNIAALPESVRNLTKGSHHSIQINERYYHVEVDERQQQLIYLTYDITLWEEQEHELLQILAYGIAVVLMTAIFMGISASRTILSPIRKLTARVASIQPGERNIQIASEFEGSEIGPIANAVDSYLQRLDQFVERERSFTAAASHELRTPLSVMMGAVDVLDANPQSAPSTRAIKRINRACAEMLAFIEATLFLSREKASSINQESPADITAIITRLLEDNRDKIEQNGIHIETQLSDSLIINRPQSIVQITIGNLLRNAIEHTSEGSIRISLNNRRLVIQDTGEGIPTEQLPHVFDRSYTTKTEGTGLGLNLVKRICDRFNWTVTIDSILGQGTTITLDFSDLGVNCTKNPTA